MTPIEIIAHRGYSARAPENTLAALEHAVRAQADAIEFDVHTAACGTPVLFHDTNLSRTTNGVGPLRRRTLKQLQALDAGSWFAPEFKGEPIPTLQEALERLRGRTGRIFAEVKGYRELEDLDRMVRIARETSEPDTVVFISLNWTILDRIRGQDAALPIGYVVSEAGEIDEAFRRAKGDRRALVDLRARLVLDDPDLPERAAAQKTELAVWTVNDPNEAARLYDVGVRRFTTNEVTLLRNWASWRRREKSGG